MTFYKMYKKYQYQKVKAKAKRSNISNADENLCEAVLRKEKSEAVR